MAAAEREPDRDPFVPGQELARRFTLRARLGVGGVGEVWSATNKGTGGPVALKLVRKSAVSRDTAARFRHEASLSASLSHRNIVRVFDYFEERDGTLGLVMEYLRGENARERLLRTGVLPAQHAISIATQVLSALSHAHDLGIVHRDIKPPNVLLATEPDGNVTPKLLDFGIAKTASSSVVTLDGQLLGTPRYMSPEQIRGERDIDGRSDVFSVAVMVYELLTGRCPFAAPFATASLAAVLEGRVARDARIAEPVWNVLENALAKNPAERIQTADAFADQLREAVAAGEGALSNVLRCSNPEPPAALDSGHAVAVPLALASAESSGGFSPAGAPSARRERGKRLVTVAVAACALVLVIGMIRSSMRSGSSDPALSPREVHAAAGPSAAPLPPPHVPDVSDGDHGAALAASSVVSPSPPQLEPPESPRTAPSASARANSHAGRAPSRPKSGIARNPGF